MTRPARTYALPLSALDQVLLLDLGRIRTRKAITANEPFFPGHYPDHPIYPGVFIVEAVCQAIGRYAAQYNQSARLQRIISTRFRLPVEPGDTLDTDCVCTREADAATVTVKAVCSSANGKVADVKATFHLERHK